LPRRSAVDFDALGPLDWLSTTSGKVDRYSDEVYFRETAEDLFAVLAPSAVERFCRQHTLLLLKPDAVVAGRLTTAIAWLTGNAFRVAAAAVTRFNRNTVRALWQETLVNASRDRVELADDYMTAAECLLLLVQYSDPHTTASAVLGGQKGPPQPQLCLPGQLRYELGAMNYQLNRVHAADDPADMVRELGVLCDYPTRLDLLHSAASETDGLEAARTLVDRLEAGHPRMVLSFDRTVQTIREAIARRQQHGDDSLRELARAVDHITAGTSRDWRSLLHLLERNGIQTTRWQRIVLGTTLLEPNRSGHA
jgi:nucleoside diphosphate kinase